MTTACDTTGNIAGGGFIECRSGFVFDLRNPDPAMIVPNDIAMSLSMQCRYCGHCRFFYSVAEHCCHAHDLVLRRYADLFKDADATIAELAFAVLMHDASEAYLIDLPRPVKPMVPGYVELEHRIQAAIRDRFGIKDSESIHKAVKKADNLVLRAEGAMLMPSKGETWGFTEDITLLDCIELEGWQPAKAAAEFTKRFDCYRDVD